MRIKYWSKRQWLCLATGLPLTALFYLISPPAVGITSYVLAGVFYVGVVWMLMMIVRPRSKPADPETIFPEPEEEERVQVYDRFPEPLKKPKAENQDVPF